MKVGIISSFDESLINFRIDLIKHLISKNFEVHVIAPSFSNTNKKILESIGVITKSIYFKRTKINPLLEIITIIKFYFFFRRNKYDKIILYTAKPVIFGSIAAKLANIESINSLITGLGHYFISRSFYSLLIKKILINLYRISLNFNNNVIFQNNDDKKYFIKLKIFKSGYRNIFTVSGSGVNTEYFYPLPYPKNTSFILVTRLLKEKGVIEYINACQFISKKYKDIYFYLGGWIDNHPNSIKIKDLNKINSIKNFTYLGKITDMRKAISNASIFVLPSYREGLPKVVIEAMASGRPIITSDVPGCRETVKDKHNGYLVKHASTNSLIEAMEKFIKRPNQIEDMGINSRNFAIRKFDVNKVNKEMMNIIFKNV